MIMLILQWIEIPEHYSISLQRASASSSHQQNRLAHHLHMDCDYIYFESVEQKTLKLTAVTMLITGLK